VVGNEMMMADLAYYNSTPDAAKRGKASATCCKKGGCVGKRGTFRGNTALAEG